MVTHPIVPIFVPVFGYRLFLTNLSAPSPNDEFNKPFRNKILITDLTVPLRLTAPIVPILVARLFLTNLSAPSPNDEFNKPFRNKILTDFLTASLKKFFLRGRLVFNKNNNKKLKLFKKADF